MNSLVRNESLAFFTPLYNEAGNVARVGSEIVEALGKMGLADYHYTMVDDGSGDSTRLEALELAATDTRHITVVSHPHNYGYGGALRTGFAESLRTGHSLVGFMDGDGQFDPNDAGTLIESMLVENTDAALGIREERCDSTHRLILGKAWKYVSGKVLDCDVTDVDCGFKIFRSETMEPVVPRLISRAGAAISPEIIARAKSLGSTFSEVTVTHKPRTQGKSTGGRPSVALRSLMELSRVRRDMMSGNLEDPVVSALPVLTNVA